MSRDEELHQAKVLLLRQIPLSEASFDQIAGGWISRSELDLPLDEPIHAAHRYLELNATDVRAAFEKWIRPRGFRAGLARAGAEIIKVHPRAMS